MKATKIFRVSGTSQPEKLAGAISSIVKDETVKLNCIGAAAVNVAVKAVAISRGHLVPSGVDLSIQPSFQEVDINGEIKTGMSLLIRLIEA